MRSLVDKNPAVRRVEYLGKFRNYQLLLQP
jgi:hypothetical protein